MLAHINVVLLHLQDQLLGSNWASCIKEGFQGITKCPLDQVKGLLVPPGLVLGYKGKEEGLGEVGGEGEGKGSA